jgi:hypothetical protein
VSASPMPALRHQIPRILAAAAIVVAVISHGWLVNAGREMHGGLLSFDSGGELWSNAELVAAAQANGAQDVSTMFPTAGWLTVALGLLASALLLGAAVTSARWLRRATLVALGAALLAGIAFLFTKPTGPAFGIGPGWSAMLFVVGAAVGAFSVSATRPI